VKGDPAEKDLKMPTIKYIEKLNQHIEAALKAAGANVKKAQAEMKSAYDQKSSVRQLQPGELALILLPTEASKLFAEWRGPYRVLRRCQNNNYVLDVNGREGMMHINSLRRYYSREDPEPVSMVISELSEDEEAVTGEAGEAELPRAPPGEFRIGEQLTAQQRQEMQQLLGRYGMVFSDEPGTTHLMEHSIRLSDDLPCFQPAYRVPEPMRDAVEEELTRMLNNGIIQYDYNTKYNSPLVVVKKPNGKIRLVNNFINLNKKTVNEQFTMSNPNELLNRAAGFKYVSKVDLGSAFYQLPISLQSQPYTGFHTFMGSFSYRKLPLGLKCASASFQKLMELVLRGMHRFAGTLLDDTLIFSSTFQEHLEHVSRVLDRLKEAGLTANKEKCSFAANRIKIFGHLLVDGLVYPDEDKVAAIAA